MNRFDIYNDIVLAEFVQFYFPHILGSKMRIRTDFYWPNLEEDSSMFGNPDITLHAQGNVTVDPSNPYGSAYDLFRFGAGLIDELSDERYQLVVNRRWKSNSDGKSIYVNDYYKGLSSIVLDRYNGNTYKPKAILGFNNTYFYDVSTSADNRQYEDSSTYPEIVDIPSYDQNGVWYIDSSFVQEVTSPNVHGLTGGSYIYLTVGTSMSNINCGKVKLYDVILEEYDTNLGQWNVIEKYVPCIYNNGTQGGVVGLVNSSRTIFTEALYSTQNAGCLCYVENPVNSPEDEFHDLFNCEVKNFYRELYTSNMGPLRAYKAIGTLAALQSLITNNMTHIGELISVIDDNSNNGLYHIVQGNNGLTYKKISFA